MSFNPKVLKSKKKDRPPNERKNVSHLISHSHIIETRKTKVYYPSNDNSIKSLTFSTNNINLLNNKKFNQ